jgi:dTDP-4-amino-4,6-dideoxygalactose transaminase
MTTTEPRTLVTTHSRSSVPFFSGAASLERDWHRLAGRLRSLSESGRFTYGALGQQLESVIAARTGARHAIAVGNGTDALIILLRAAGIGPGDEVIVPAYSFFATASSVVHVGAEPVMVDVLPGSYAMDPQAARAAITRATKAIMPVHLFCQMADMRPLRDLAEEYGLLLLEDSAEGITMRMGGRHAGLWGAGGVLSFFPTKTLGALGDAGMVLTNDDAIARRCRRLRSHGQEVEGSYEYSELGYNSRLDEIQSAVLLTRLESLDVDIAARARLASHYDARLAALAPQVTIPWRPRTVERGNTVYYVYLIESERRDELAGYLAEHGVGTEVYYPRPLTEQPALKNRIGNRHPVPVSLAASRRAVALPLYPTLTGTQLDYICDVITEFHEGHL